MGTYIFGSLVLAAIIYAVCSILKSRKKGKGCGCGGCGGCGKKNDCG